MLADAEDDQRRCPPRGTGSTDRAQRRSPDRPNRTSTGERPERGGRRRRRSSAPGPWSSCRSRGSRGGSWPGAAGPQTPDGRRRRGDRDARRGRRARRAWSPALRRSRSRAAVTADAFAAPVGEVLGWLVAAGAGQVGGDAGAERAVAGSRRDLGGRAHRARRDGPAAAPAQAGERQPTTSRTASYSVRWTPALIDAGRLARDGRRDARAACSPSTRASTPGRSPAPRSPAWSTRSAATARAGIEVPAPPPRVRTATDVAEAFLARLDGSAFDAPIRGRRRHRRPASSDWARSVTGEHAPLIVRLDPPDDGDAWHLAVFAPGAQGRARPDRAGDRRRRLRSRATSKTRWRGSNGCCPRCCARAARAAARWCSARTRRGS